MMGLSESEIALSTGIWEGGEVSQSRIFCTVILEEYLAIELTVIILTIQVAQMSLG